MKFKLEIFSKFTGIFITGKTAAKGKKLPRFNRPQNHRLLRCSSAVLDGSNSQKMSEQRSPEEIANGYGMCSCKRFTCPISWIQALSYYIYNNLKVVDALKSIMEGTATSNIRGFSPGSDYGSSTSYSDSSESPSQSEDTSLSVDTTSVSSMNVRYPPTPPIQTFRRHPPSPSLPARRSTSSVQRRGYVLYDEMII